MNILSGLLYKTDNEDADYNEIDRMPFYHSLYIYKLNEVDMISFIPGFIVTK